MKIKIKYDKSIISPQVPTKAKIPNRPSHGALFPKPSPFFPAIGREGVALTGGSMCSGDEGSASIEEDYYSDADGGLGQSDCNDYDDSNETKVVVPEVVFMALSQLPSNDFIFDVLGV